MKKYSVILIPAIVALSGCAGANSYLANRSTTVEMYHIFDIKTSVNTATIAKATTSGLSQNTNDIREAMPLQLGKAVPKVPGRFTLKEIASVFGGSGGALLQMAQMQGGNISMKVASCEDSVWNSKATRTISGSSDLQLYSCLYKYKDGYNLNMYAVFTKQEGGLYQISQTVANSIVGTPEQWVNKTIMDTVRSIEKATSAKAVHLEGQPELGDLPSIDKMVSK